VPDSVTPNFGVRQVNASWSLLACCKCGVVKACSHSPGLQQPTKSARRLLKNPYGWPRAEWMISSYKQAPYPNQKSLVVNFCVTVWVDSPKSEHLCPRASPWPPSAHTLIATPSVNTTARRLVWIFIIPSS
jgi:hypothetical protein